MDLKNLYDELLAHGCNRFYIEGIGGPQSDDIECLGYNDGKWEVYYTERGQKSKPLFSTPDMAEAVQFYHNHVMQLEHRHMVTFTRSPDVLTSYKTALERCGVRTVQNDIPHYSATGDRIFRLFVTNSDIFKAQELFGDLPYFDEDLKQ
jgi:hypothetical protein